MNKKPHRIKCLPDYVREITQIQLISEMESNPPKLLFRGHSNNNYSLTPSLARYPSKTWFNTWQSVEMGLIQTAQQKFSNLFSPSDYPAILLAKLQHYGIYTRMLDLTSNALVALYFACNQSPDDDGEVFAFSTYPVSAYNPYVNAIADSYRLAPYSATDFNDYCYKVTKQPYYTSCLYKCFEDNWDKCTQTLENRTQQPICVEVGNICERQTNQGGYFFIFPNKLVVPPQEIKNLPPKYLSDNLVSLSKEDKMVIKRLIIPKEIKSQIIDDLRRFGISNEFLFADSVDQVCRGIVAEYREHYPG